eukprot:4731513-Prymnesium_polylepis.1
MGLPFAGRARENANYYNTYMYPFMYVKEFTTLKKEYCSERSVCNGERQQQSYNRTHINLTHLPGLYSLMRLRHCVA